MSNKPRFLADAMLGNIARKLRLLGFDCKYYATIKDEQMLSIAKNENRVLITKDHEISNICKKQNIATIDLLGTDEMSQIVEICKKRNIVTIDLLSTDEMNQIVEICKKISVNKCKIDITNVRCTLCNGIIQPIEKEKIIDRIPIKIVQSIQQFWICDFCNHIYWEGTHIRNLQKFTDEINERL